MLTSITSHYDHGTKSEGQYQGQQGRMARLTRLECLSLVGFALVDAVGWCDAFGKAGTSEC